MDSENQFFVYIIHAPLHNKFYKGSTHNLLRRLRQHNEGKSRFTKNFKPWKLIYAETYPNKTDALRREIRLKKYSHSQIQRLISVSHPNKVDIDKYL